MKAFKRLWDRVLELESIIQECSDYDEAVKKSRATKYLAPQTKDEEFLELVGNLINRVLPHISKEKGKRMAGTVISIYEDYMSKYNCKIYISPLLLVCRNMDRFCGHLSRQANMYVFERLTDYEAAGSLWDGEAIGIPREHTIGRCVGCREARWDSDFVPVVEERQHDYVAMPIPASLLNQFDGRDSEALYKRVRVKHSREQDL